MAGHAAFEWDDRKARANLAKHGIAFDLAARVLADPATLSVDVPDVEQDEERWITYALVPPPLVVLLVIVWTPRGDTTRLISARKATNWEYENYAKDILNQA